MEPAEYALEVGARLRAVRMRRGWSLRAAGEQSGGALSGVTIGSYERADRALTVGKLAGLAAFYKVPVASLLPDEDAPSPDSRVTRLAEALHEAGIGPGDYACDIARRLVLAGVAAPRAKRGAA